MAKASGATGCSSSRTSKLPEDLLGAVVHRIQIPAEVADSIAVGIRSEQISLDRGRKQSLAHIIQRLRTARAKLGRAYEDYLEGRISQEFWERRSPEWEEDQRALRAEVERLSRSIPTFEVTAERTLELAKGAHSRYLAQPYPERRRLLDAVLSNCTFDRGTLCPDWRKPFDLFVQGNESGDWRAVRDEFLNWLATAA